MKKFTFALLTILLASVSTNHLFAQDESVRDEPVQDGARIEFKKEVHDYGEVAYGGNGYCTFEFTNTGNAPLIISEAKKSCGCTVPSWPKEPIAPGETGTIKVKYDMKRPGAINKNVTIISNAVNAPTQIIRIKGRVLPKPEAGTPVNKVAPAVK